MTVIAIVQARTASTRLPRKVFLEISGQPMLYHVIDRLRRAERLNEIVITTSTSESDRAIVTYAAELGVRSFAGSESDVLDRFFGAATMASADQIVRVTGDCPLVDPGVVDAAIVSHLKQGVDYTGNLSLRTFPRGLDVEVFSVTALSKAHQLGTRPRHREHVTPFIYENPQIFQIASFEAPKGLRRPDLRLVVDTEEDLQLLREIYRRFYTPGQIVDVREVIQWLDDEPSWRTINLRAEEEHLARNARDGVRQVKLPAEVNAQ